MQSRQSFYSTVGISTIMLSGLTSLHAQAMRGQRAPDSPAGRECKGGSCGMGTAVRQSPAGESVMTRTLHVTKGHMSSFKNSCYVVMHPHLTMSMDAYLLQPATCCKVGAFDRPILRECVCKPAAERVLQSCSSFSLRGGKNQK